MNRVNGIRFDGLHSFHDFGMWLSERPDWGSPEPKLNLVEIPGADGVLDLTEANAGEVKFNNRQITLTFAAMVKAEEQERFKSRIMNTLHGKVIQQIIPDEDPDWYYTGRCTVSFANVNAWKMQILITVDAAPYAMKLNKTTVALINGVSDGETVRVERSVNIYEDSPNAKVSFFRFGDRDFPTGVIFSGSPDLKIAWKQGANVPNIGNLNVNIYSSDGTSFSKDITSSVSLATVGGARYTATDGEISITMAELIAGNISPSLVYLVRIEIAGCKIYTESELVRFRAWNERKSVVPVFDLEATTSVMITVGEQDYRIYPGMTQNEGIVFTQGWNEICVPANEYVPVSPDPEPNITWFAVVYREGKL